MFRKIILPIFRSTRLCVTVCGMMHRRCCRPVIINKPLLLHLVGCLYYLYQWCTVKQISDNEIYLLIKYIKSVLWRVVIRLFYIEEARCLKVNEWRAGLPNLKGGCWKQVLELVQSTTLAVRGSHEPLTELWEADRQNMGNSTNTESARDMCCNTEIHYFCTVFKKIPYE